MLRPKNAWCRHNDCTFEYYQQCSRSLVCSWHVVFRNLHFETFPVFPSLVSSIFFNLNNPVLPHCILVKRAIWDHLMSSTLAFPRPRNTSYSRRTVPSCGANTCRVVDEAGDVKSRTCFGRLWPFLFVTNYRLRLNLVSEQSPTLCFCLCSWGSRLLPYLSSLISLLQSLFCHTASLQHNCSQRMKVDTLQAPRCRSDWTNFHTVSTKMSEWLDESPHSKHQDVGVIGRISTQ